MNTTEPSVERNSGNVSVDLNHAGVDAHLMMEGLVSRLGRIVRQRGMGQAFVSPPRFPQTRLCCPNSDSVPLWTGRNRSAKP